MPKAKQADVKASAQPPIVKATAFQRGTPIEEYVARLRASHSPSNDIEYVRGSVAKGLEGQGYPDAEIYRVVKTIK